MTTWGIVIAVLATIFGLAGIFFLFWGWDRKNKKLNATLHFILAAAGGGIFAGLIYLGAKLGLLW
ncbi:hypothetical protein JXM67_05410 [candidate division WOR-3 bacterium]|nr:hypothetical protein [candidate division WOR-3 bacterium]